MSSVLIIAVMVIVIYLLFRNVQRDNKIEAFCSDQNPEYVRLKNLLEDCTLVNKDFRVQIAFELTVGGAVRYTINFLDIKNTLLIFQYTLKEIEQRISSDYNAEVYGQKGSADMRTVIRNASDTAFHARLLHQKQQDANFFQNLFVSRPPESREYIIRSPFESYASSGGEYILDTDLWKREEDITVYTDHLRFDTVPKELVPFIIEKAAKEFNCSVRRYSDGCYISSIS